MNPRDLVDLLRRNPDLRVEGDGYASAEPRLASPAPKLSERELQAAVIAECDRRAATIAEYGLILAIPNGQVRPGQRVEPGLRAGVPDLLLACPSGQFHGLFIELKCGRNKPSRAQLEWIRRLSIQGYKCVVIWDSVDDVMAAIDEYLGEI